jgi:hypothetical protein
MLPQSPGWYMCTPPMKDNVMKRGTVVTCLACQETWRAKRDVPITHVLYLLWAHRLFECARRVSLS